MLSHIRPVERSAMGGAEPDPEDPNAANGVVFGGAVLVGLGIVGVLMIPVTAGASAAVLPLLTLGTGVSLVTYGVSKSGTSSDSSTGSLTKTGGLAAGTNADYDKGYAAGRADGAASIGHTKAQSAKWNAKASVKWQQGYRDGFDLILHSKGATVDEDGNIDWYSASEVAKAAGSLFS